MRARSLWLAAPGAAELRDEVLPAPGDGEVQVAALFSAISRGTECLVFRGQVPASEYARMRCPFQEGAFPAPVKYGYCSVGRIEAGPPAMLGRNAFCLYPHQDRYVVPAAALTLVPEAVPPLRAVLAANLETALNGLWDSGLTPGDRVSVIGAGVVGCLIARLAARTPGCVVTVIDIDGSRAELAAALGCAFAAPDDAPGDQDIVFHASASEAGARRALELAGRDALVVEMSWFGARPVSLPLGEAFHSQRLRLISSQVGALAPAKRHRFDHARRMAVVMDLLHDATLDQLIAPPITFEALPATLAHLASGDASVLCQPVRYDPAT